MTDRDRLHLILQGEVPDRPPHFEIDFQLGKEMLQDTDERRIRESVRYCMKHGGLGKRYIFSTSNCIFKGMPPESYRIMPDEYQRISAASSQELPTQNDSRR